MNLAKLTNRSAILITAIQRVHLWTNFHHFTTCLLLEMKFLIHTLDLLNLKIWRLVFRRSACLLG